MNKIKYLSHSGLEVMERCPRCFWLKYNYNIKQPEGIVSRLANRYDAIIKNYFDTYRNLNQLPEMISDKISGKLENPFQEKYFVKLSEKYGFYGKLDECLINNNSERIPLDFKTSSSDPRKNSILNAYQTQIEDYIFLINNCGKKAANYGFLLFFYPLEGKFKDGFPLLTYLVKVVGDPNNTIKRINRGIDILEEKIPNSSPNCNFCNWYLKINSFNKEAIFETSKSRKFINKKNIHDKNQALLLDF